MTLQEIRQRKAAKVAEQRAMLAKAQTENRNLNAEEVTKFDALKAEVTDLEAAEARQQFVDDAERRSAGVTVIAGNGGDTIAALESRVSLMRVLQAGVEGRALTGAELEYAQETERRTGRKAQGVFVPMSALERRVNTTGSAPELVPTDHRGDLYIQPLRNKLLARRLGVRVLSGLHGNVTIPKHGTGVSVGWVAENGAVPDSDVNPSNITLAPKHAGGVTELSRQLIMQSSPDVEQLVRDDFAAVLAQAIDSALIKGGGTNEPTGVLSTVGIQTANLATLNWANVLAMKAKAELANVDASSWLFNPSVAAKFAGTEKSTGTGIYLLGDDGRMAGIQSYSTNQVPNNATPDPDTGIAILGDWSQVLLGIWSEIDILVNPYAQPAYGRGGVLVRAMSTVDVGVRHPQAFVVASDIAL
ncbi:MAG: phage major capsid protein [Pseudoxanthomonas sp.]|jgi:HK97 family phage major capsid protein|uniref:phage major capsid protein n=1 Tax=Pseudoxanthomonas sp. TaxID=1871049 RepID=UPI00258884B7|nr:phage major capsid protein [Pseudoxanthomonas sp.]MCH2092034.1 phage major capsid protein [Pseudoxanthomonas sp.]